MSNFHLNIEKLCLEALHNGNKDVCNFVKDGYQFVSDSYTVWVLEQKYDQFDPYMKYTNDDRMKEKIFSLTEKYRRKEPMLPLEQKHETVITRGYTASKYENWGTGYEAWIQDKYIVTFELFDPEFCVYPDWDESKPIAVIANDGLIGLIMPMHVNEECRAKKEQAKL